MASESEDDEPVLPLGSDGVFFRSFFPKTKEDERALLKALRRSQKFQWWGSPSESPSRRKKSAAPPAVTELTADDELERWRRTHAR
jgi:hypothetical protein